MIEIRCSSFGLMDLDSCHRLPRRTRGVDLKQWVPSARRGYLYGHDITQSICWQPLPFEVLPITSEIQPLLIQASHRSSNSLFLRHLSHLTFPQGAFPPLIDTHGECLSGTSSKALSLGKKRSRSLPVEGIEIPETPSTSLQTHPPKRSIQILPLPRRRHRPPQHTLPLRFTVAVH